MVDVTMLLCLMFIVPGKDKTPSPMHTYAKANKTSVGITKTMLSWR